MIREELEFRIARYADGTLPAEQRPAVEAEVAADGAARAALAQYQGLQRAVGQAARLPLPPIRWDRLADHLSAVVAAGVADNQGQGQGADGESLVPPSGALDERTEFAIACYADGTLEPAKRGEVEHLLTSDGRARALLDEYENLDATAKGAAHSAPFPAVNWGRLARQLGEATAAGAGVVLPEPFEQQVAAYAEGRVPPAERDEVEARLAAEPAARVALSEYQNLDAALRALPAAAPIPPVDFARLAQRISNAVVALDPAASEADAFGQTFGQTFGQRGSIPSSYRIGSWLRSPVRLAAAASVLIATALGAILLRHKPPGPQPTPEPASYADVSPLKPEEAPGAAVAEVQIGPPRDLAQAGDEGEDPDDGVVTSPPRAFVASGLPTPQETDVLPAMPF